MRPGRALFLPRPSTAADPVKPRVLGAAVAPTVDPATAGRGRNPWGLPLTLTHLGSQEKNRKNLIQFFTRRSLLVWIKPNDPLQATGL